MIRMMWQSWYDDNDVDNNNDEDVWKRVQVTAAPRNWNPPFHRPLWSSKLERGLGCTTTPQIALQALCHTYKEKIEDKIKRPLFQWQHFRPFPPTGTSWEKFVGVWTKISTKLSLYNCSLPDIQGRHTKGLNKKYIQNLRMHNENHVPFDNVFNNRKQRLSNISGTAKYGIRWKSGSRPIYSDCQLSLLF